MGGNRMVMKKELKLYKDLDVLSSPTQPDSVYFVYSSATNKVSQIWVTSNQNIAKKVVLSDTNALDLISNQVDNTLVLGADGKLFVPNNKFTADIVVSLSNGKTAGKYLSGETIPLVGKTAQQAFNDIFIETLIPTLTQPSLGVVTLNQNLLQETGTTLNVLTALATFNRGSIFPQYTSANASRAGLSNTHIYTGAGGFTGTLANIGNAVSRTVNNYIVTLGNNIFSLGVNYDAGTQPKDSVGNNFNTPLSAGNVSGVVTLIGAYLNFLGSVLPSGSLPTDSSGVRALTSSTFGNTFSIGIPAGQTKISFAYPATKPNIVDSSVKYVQGFNSNVGNIFTQSIFNVNDAGGNPVSYKVYTTTLPAPEANSITYNVTLT